MKTKLHYSYVPINWVSQIKKDVTSCGVCNTSCLSQRHLTTIRLVNITDMIMTDGSVVEAAEVHHPNCSPETYRYIRCPVASTSVCMKGIWEGKIWGKNLLPCPSDLRPDNCYCKAFQLRWCVIH